MPCCFVLLHWDACSKVAATALLTAASAWPFAAAFEAWLASSYSSATAVESTTIIVIVIGKERPRAVITITVIIITITIEPATVAGSWVATFDYKSCFRFHSWPAATASTAVASGRTSAAPAWTLAHERCRHQVLCFESIWFCKCHCPSSGWRLCTEPRLHCSTFLSCATLLSCRRSAARLLTNSTKLGGSRRCDRCSGLIPKLSAELDALPIFVAGWIWKSSCSGCLNSSARSPGYSVRQNDADWVVPICCPLECFWIAFDGDLRWNRWPASSVCWLPRWEAASDLRYRGVLAEIHLKDSRWSFQDID